MKWLMVVVLLSGVGAWGRPRSPEECRVALKNYLSACDKLCAKNLKKKDAKFMGYCSKNCRDQSPAFEKGCLSGKPVRPATEHAHTH